MDTDSTLVPKPSCHDHKDPAGEQPRLGGRTYLPAVAHQTQRRGNQKHEGKDRKDVLGGHLDQAGLASQRCWRHAGALVGNSGVPGCKSDR